jgi:chromosome segregation ATPase
VKEVEHTRKMLKEAELARQDLKASLEEAADRTKEKVEAMKKEQELLIEENRNLNKSNVELSGKVTKLVQENTSLKEKIAVLTLDNKKLRIDINELKEEQKDNKKLESTLKQLQTLKSNIEIGYKGSLNEAEKETNNHKARIDKLLKENRELAEKNNEQAKVITRLECDLKQSEVERENLQELNRQLTVMH